MSVAGQWNVTMDTPLGAQQFTLTFTEAAGAWSGSMVGGRTGTTELKNMQVAGTVVSFETNVNSPMGALTLNMSGTIAGDAITGTCKTMFGNAEFKGVRV